jgi:hypothetical protein
MAVDFPFADPATEEGRRSLFFGALQRQFGPQLSFGQQRYGADAFRGFENRFLGQGGQQILAGGAPTRTWVDFLNDLNVGREFRRAPTAQTGLGTSRFTSPGRFLLNL